MQSPSQTTFSHLQAEVERHGARLVGVSKTKPVAQLQTLYDQGLRDFGENKAQEMVTKAQQLPADIRWHMIGHLQTNKVKYIAPFVHLIHSVDSLKLLREIDKQGRKYDRAIGCLLQIHIAEEDTKFGFSPDEAEALLLGGELASLHHVRLVGLMGMATFTKDTAQVRREFHGLRLLFDAFRSRFQSPPVQLTELSMGMSGDYPIALEVGSTLVRIGSLLFGERS